MFESRASNLGILIHPLLAQSFQRILLFVTAEKGTRERVHVWRLGWRTYHIPRTYKYEFNSEKYVVMRWNLGEGHLHGVTTFSHMGREQGYFPTTRRSLCYLTIASWLQFEWQTLKFSAPGEDASVDANGSSYDLSTKLQYVWPKCPMNVDCLLCNTRVEETREHLADFVN